MWNFRIIKRGKGKKAYYAIYEVFYDTKGKPNACTKDSVDVGGEDANAIRWVLNKMRLALKKPVLKYEYFEELEKKICTCPKECDCANPPPDDWDGKNGCWSISNSCPIHNDNPDPDPDCPMHSK